MSFLLIPVTNLIHEAYAAPILTEKWRQTTGVPFTSIGALVADVTGDSDEEVIVAGLGGVAVFDGDDGHLVWSQPVPGADSSCQYEIGDLNNDGKFEILVSSTSPAKLYAFHGDGTTFWVSPTLGGRAPGDFVMADIDGDGYPTVFVATMFTSSSNNDGTLSALSGQTGEILKQVWSWHPCAGGLSIADCDGDGDFELFMNDRSSGLGLGVIAYRAETLETVWNRKLSVSSNRPMLADVNNDGVLDVIAVSYTHLTLPTILLV